MWLSVRIYFHIFIGKGCLECSDQCASVHCIIFQTLQELFISHVHCRQDDCLIFFDIRTL